MPVVTPKSACTPEQLVEQLLALPDTETQKRFIQTHCCLFDNETVAELIKGASDQLLRSDLKHSLALAELVTYQGTVTHNEAIRALGLLAEANVYSIGLREFPRAIELATAGAEIYQCLGRPHDQARVEIALLFPLSCLGRYTEAIEVGERIQAILRTYESWRLLVITTMNLAIVHYRHGEDQRSLTMLGQASALCQQLPVGREAQEGLIENNRAVALRNLGRFEEALTASKKALEVFTHLGFTAEAARAQQSMALTYYVQGRYNEALQQLDQAQAVFLADGRERDAMLVELFLCDCLLQLRRFANVLEKCDRALPLFLRLGERPVAAQTYVKQAVAYANLARYDEAMVALDSAYQIFREGENQAWMALTQLEQAAVLQQQGHQQASLTLIMQILAALQQYGLQVEEAHAYILAARSSWALGQTAQAEQFAQRALAIGQATHVLAIAYQGEYLLGTLASAAQEPYRALVHYDAAMEALERLRGRMMLEFRAGFVEDKQLVYEDAIALTLRLGDAERGLEYVERAKSRALLDLLTHRVHLGIQARQPADQVLVDELTTLRTRRDQLYRRLESSEEMKTRGWSLLSTEQLETQQEIVGLEQQITERWHKLLIHNADYARDATLWQVYSEPVRPLLPPDTTLVEYFVVHGQLVAFVANATGVVAQPLSCTVTEIEQTLRLLLLNLNRVMQSTAAQLPALTHNVKGILQRLYRVLWAPIQPLLETGHSVIVAPYGPLHYIPFHALYDGARYLLEAYEITYLPSASLLRHLQTVPPSTQGAFVYGHSLGGKLPSTQQEARQVAEMLHVQPRLENELALADLPAMLATSRLIHLATHGDFRSDNPLFSGLIVGDQCLTTLDVFNLRLQASLVTLSACQTGRSQVQGGDELAGLMKAFLSAGAASLILTLWPVFDTTTMHLMTDFYGNLMKGQAKSAALRTAQLAFLQGANPDQAHPYFWAPFMLVGNRGPL